MKAKKFTEQFRFTPDQRTGRFEFTAEQFEVFNRMRTDLALSKDKLAKALMTSSLELSEQNEVESGSFFISNDQKNANNAFRMNPEDPQITVSLQLTCYKKEDDPIGMILPRLSSLVKMPKQKIVKQLYLSFLVENDVLAIDENSNIVEVDLIPLIHGDSFKPYGWSGNVFFEWAAVKSGTRSYSFLSKGKFKRINSLTIQFNESDDFAIMETLGVVCEKLHRNESEFLKMLLMYWFRLAGILDNQFLLKSDWNEKLFKLAEMFLIHK